MTENNTVTPNLEERPARRLESRVGRSLKALVIVSTGGTAEFGSLLAVARAEARRRERAAVNPPVRALQFVPDGCLCCGL